jgi:hypothetical protein
MRTLLAVMLAFLPLVLAQDSLLLKSVEPSYDKYNEDLATDFDAASASVTLTVLANGKPFSLDKSSVPLPMAVMMALKGYEFWPQGAFPHGRPETEADTYQVTLNVPIRKSKAPVRQNEDPRAPHFAVLVGPGVARGLLVKHVPPESSEYVRHNRIQGRITLAAVISQQGDVVSLQPSGGPFVLIETAYDAAKQWQFRPYILNGELVEVVTDLEVVFMN